MSRKRHKKKNEQVREPATDARNGETETETETEDFSAEAAEVEPASGSEGEGEGEGEGADETEPEIDGDDADALRTAIDRLKRETAELQDLAQRKQAEFENFRRRTERERADFVRHAAADFVLDILPVFDNLGRAVEAAEQGSEDQLREGVGIIYRQFKDILERNGLEEIECEGKPFDPHIHEAVSQVDTSEHPDGTVVEVFQRGYRLKDRLLRPSMVSVARGGGETAGPSEDDPESSADGEEDEVLRHSE